MEHANGVIKARFASLKGIPIDIRSAADMPRVASWIKTCVILHNVLIHLRDEFEIAEVDDDDPGMDTVVPQAPLAKVFCDAVRDRWLRDVQGWV